MHLDILLTVTNGELNPANIVLNRTIFNVNPNRTGFDAFNLGTSNLMGFRSLNQMFSVDETTGKTTLKNMKDVIAGRSVKMFDVETSGVFRNSQIVQMALADISSDGTISPGFNASFKSPQLGGLMYGEQKPFSDLFSSGKIIGSENGGKEFLDESTKMINDLIDSRSVIAGHNLNFDIQKLTGTMKQMPAYANHEGAKAAIERLHSSIESGETTLLDTLEYTRAYMNDLVNSAVDEEFARTGAARTDSEVAKLYRQFIYSPETMADIRIGGGAAYSSVEAIALNTDLTARIVRDAEAGDEAAKVLLDKMQRGSHLADTDTILQSFILRYTTTSDSDERLQLARPGGGKSSSVYEALSEDAKITADNMRKKIYRSSANVPTKNIADIEHLSESTFNYILTDEGIQKVTLFSDDATKGYIRYDTTEAKFMQYSPEGVSEYSGSFDSVRGILERARGGDSGAANLIANFGVTYGQQSRAQEMRKITEAIGAASSGEMTKESILGSIGKVYKNFSSSPSLSEAIRISSSGKSAPAPFTMGYGVGSLDEYLTKAIDVARSTNQAAMPYGFLDENSRVFSTILAEATHTNAEDARLNIINQLNKEGISEEARAKLMAELDSLSYSSYMDIFSETGLSHFQTQKEAYLGLKVNADAAAESTIDFGSRVFLPTEVLQDVVNSEAVKGALGENVMGRGRVSLSVLKNKENENVINLFWQLDATAKSTDYEIIAKQLVDDALAAHHARAADTAVETGIDTATALQKLGAEFQAAIDLSKRDKDYLVKNLASRIEEGGIGYAYQGGAKAQRTISSLLRAGWDLINDKLINETASHIDVVGDTVRISAFANETALQVSGNVANMQGANATVVESLNKAANILEETKSVAEARKIMTRSRLGAGENVALNFFINNKKLIYGTGLGILAAGAGYYAYGKYKENQFYNETLEQQPTTQRPSNSNMMSYTMQEPQTSSSFRRDPLVTAGVVGNLDRNKIGHYNMSSKKHSHLFGG
jgi:hypothetical protein